MNLIINPSAGGSDVGYTGNGIKESEYSYLISESINNILKNYDINIYMTRKKNETISYDSRIKKIKTLYPDKSNTLIISNTLNYGDNTGIEIVYPLYKDNNLTKIIENNLSKYNSVITYQYRWSVDTTKDYFYLMRELTGYNIITIRYGSVDSSNDVNVIKNKYNELGEAVANSIIDFYGLKKVSNPTNFIDNSIYYIVKTGDTLSGIAKKYNTTVNNLMEINNLKSTLIHIGDKLYIYKKYIIKSGDTLSSIAKKYNTTVSEIKKINNLQSDFIVAGKYLYIP